MSNTFNQAEGDPKPAVGATVKVCVRSPAGYMTIPVEKYDPTVHELYAVNDGSTDLKITPTLEPKPVPVAPSTVTTAEAPHLLGIPPDPDKVVGKDNEALKPTPPAKPDPEAVRKAQDAEAEAVAAAGVNVSSARPITAKSEADDAKEAKKAKDEAKK